MLEDIEAIYEHGVFRPLEEVGLSERERVTLTVETKNGVTPDPASQLCGWREVLSGLSEAEVAEVERIALDRSHFAPAPDAGLN